MILTELTVDQLCQQGNRFLTLASNENLSSARQTSDVWFVHWLSITVMPSGHMQILNDKIYINIDIDIDISY